MARDCIAEALKAKRITRKQADQFRAMLGEMEDSQAVKEFLESFIQRSGKLRRRGEIQVLAKERAARLAAGYDDGKDMGRGIESLLARDTFERAGYSNIDFRTRAIYDKLRAEASGAYEALAVRRLGLVVDDDLAQRVGRGLFGEAVDEEASRSAKELGAAMESARIRALPAGMDIPKRRDFGVPQTHDIRRIATTPKNEWVEFAVPLVKRVYSEKGPLDSPVHIRGYLEAVHDQAAEMAAKLESGTAGGVSLDTESRRIIFRNYDAWAEYSKRFGYGEKKLMNIVDGHLRDMSRKVALLEVLGPYPRKTLDSLIEMAAKKRQLTAWQRDRINRLYSVVSGEADGVDNQRLANTGAFIRSWLVSAQLGSAWISSWGDTVTGAMTRRTNGMPVVRGLKNLFKGMSREEAARLGVAADASLLQLQANRFGDFAGVATKSGKAADFVLRASGLTEWTESGRRAFGVEFLGFMGDFVNKKTRFVELPDAVRSQLVKYGIDAGQWDNIILRTKTIEKEGAHFLDLDGFSGLVRELDVGKPFREAAETLEATERLRTGKQPRAAVGRRLEAEHARGERIHNQIQTIRNAENRMREMLATESEFAMLSGQDARVKALTTWGSARGSLVGELARTGFLYKSFPLSIMFYHLGRGVSMPTAAGKTSYLATFGAALTIVGAVSIQAREMVKGRDPRPMDQPLFWLDALGQGGALTVFEGMLEAEGNFERMFKQYAGPGFGLANDIFNLSAQNIVQLAKGKETRFGREASRFLERYTPGSNLWYSRLLLQRLWWNNLQRLLDSNPEESFWRQQRNLENWGYGQSWWRPGELTPRRAPELEAVVGE